MKRLILLPVLSLCVFLWGVCTVYTGARCTNASILAFAQCRACAHISSSLQHGRARSYAAALSVVLAFEPLYLRWKSASLSVLLDVYVPGAGVPLQHAAGELRLDAGATFIRGASRLGLSQGCLQLGEGSVADGFQYTYRYAALFSRDISAVHLCVAGAGSGDSAQACYMLGQPCVLVAPTASSTALHRAGRVLRDLAADIGIRTVVVHAPKEAPDKEALHVLTHARSGACEAVGGFTTPCELVFKTVQAAGDGNTGFIGMSLGTISGTSTPLPPLLPLSLHPAWNRRPLHGAGRRSPLNVGILFADDVLAGAAELAALWRALGCGGIASRKEDGSVAASTSSLDSSHKDGPTAMHNVSAWLPFLSFSSTQCILLSSLGSLPHSVWSGTTLPVPPDPTLTLSDGWQVAVGALDILLVAGGTDMAQVNDADFELALRVAASAGVVVVSLRGCTGGVKENSMILPLHTLLGLDREDATSLWLNQYKRAMHALQASLCPKQRASASAQGWPPLHDVINGLPLTLAEWSHAALELASLAQVQAAMQWRAFLTDENLPLEALRPLEGGPDRVPSVPSAPLVVAFVTVELAPVAAGGAGVAVTALVTELLAQGQGVVLLADIRSDLLVEWTLHVRAAPGVCGREEGICSSSQPIVANGTEMGTSYLGGRLCVFNFEHVADASSSASTRWSSMQWVAKGQKAALAAAVVHSLCTFHQIESLDFFGMAAELTAVQHAGLMWEALRSNRTWYGTAFDDDVVSARAVVSMAAVASESCREALPSAPFHITTAALMQAGHILTTPIVWGARLARAADMLSLDSASNVEAAVGRTGWSRLAISLIGRAGRRADACHFNTGVDTIALGVRRLAREANVRRVPCLPPDVTALVRGHATVHIVHAFDARAPWPLDTGMPVSSQSMKGAGVDMGDVSRSIGREATDASAARPRRHGSILDWHSDPVSYAMEAASMASAHALLAHSGPVGAWLGSAFRLDPRIVVTAHLPMQRVLGLLPQSSEGANAGSLPLECEPYSNLAHLRHTHCSGSPPSTAPCKVLLFLGRLHHVKGTELLATAAARVMATQSGGGTHLVFIGGDGDCPTHGPGRASVCVRRILSEAGGNGTSPSPPSARLHMHAPVSRACLRPVLAQLAPDLAVVPSLFETFNFVAHEMVSLGVDVVVPDAPGFAAFFGPRVDGKRRIHRGAEVGPQHSPSYVLVFRSGDEKDLVRALLQGLELEGTATSSMEIGADGDIPASSSWEGQAPLTPLTLTYLDPIQPYHSIQDAKRTGT